MVGRNTRGTRRITNMKFIIVRFSGDRLEYHGPFDSRPEAAKYANWSWADHASHIIALTEPAGIKENNLG